MKKINLLFFIIFLPCIAYSQKWHQYSDSIIENTNKNNLKKAFYFVELADAEIGKSKVIKDTIYADYLYRKSVVNYFGRINSLELLNQSLTIWEDSKKKNFFKEMKIHFFIGGNYLREHKDDLAILSYEKCYAINKNNKLLANPNFTMAIYYLAFLNNDKKNINKAEKYANEYINIVQSKAYEDFNFNFANVYGLKKDLNGQEKVLLKFLSLYNEKQLNDPKLLFKINFELFFFYSTNKNIKETIKYGEKAYEIQQNLYLNVNEELKVIFTSLIYNYWQIGDDINQNKYKRIYEKEFKENNDIDYYEELDKLIVSEDFDAFNNKFKEYEDYLISNRNYNDLMEVYALSLSLFEMNVLFKREDIDNQMKLIKDNYSLLNSENKLMFDLCLAEYYFFVDSNIEKAYQIAEKNRNTENVDLRLRFLKIKVICEFSMGIESASNSANKLFELAKEIYGEATPQLLPYYQILIEISSNNNTVIASEALRIIYDNKLENTEIASNLWSTLAKVSIQNRDRKSAINYYNKALKILDSNKVIANPLNNLQTLLGLSQAHMLERNRKESSEYLFKAKNFVENNKVLSSLALADFYLFEGEFYFDTDQFIKAKESYEKAFSLYGEKLSKSRKLNYILCDLFLKNDINATLKTLENHQKDVKLDNHLSKIIYLLKYNNGEFDVSRKLLVNQLKKLINDNNKYFHLLSNYEREQIHENFIDQFEFLNTHLLTGNDDFIKEYIDLRFYSKSLLFFNSFKTDIADENTKVFYSEYKNNITLINRYYETPTIENSKEIENLKARNNELEKFISINNVVVTTPTLKTLNSKLKVNEAFIEIIRINKQSRSTTKKGIDIVKQFTDSIYYGAIIIKKDKTPKFIVLDDKNQLESNYFPKFQSFIQGKNKLDKDTESYKVLFESIDNELAGIDKVYMITDGIYNSINVESVFNPNKQKYIIDYLKIKLIQSVRSITDEEKGTEKTIKLRAALFGNPDFDLVSNFSKSNNLIRDLDTELISELKTKQKIGYLPGTEKEIQTITSILKEADWKIDLYSMSLASENNIKKTASPTILHIATHGFFNKNTEIRTALNSVSSLYENKSSVTSYLKSGLLFSGAQNTINGENLNVPDNGILTGEEAKILDLKNTELVVLSACETGLGDNLVGEGVVGLQRAFMIAGAKSVIMSLWKVDDTSTQKLMTSFYTNLIKNRMSKSDAFYAAKTEMKKLYPQPYYWAGFVLLE